MSPRLNSVLSLTTSHQQGSMVLRDSDLGFSGKVSFAGKHAEKVLQGIRDLDQQYQTRVGRAVPWEKLDGILWDQGPGSFTGLRVSLSLIKTLAYLKSTPVYLLNSHQILAAGLPPGTAVICENAYQDTVYLSKVLDGALVSGIEVVPLQDIPDHFFQHSACWYGDGINLLSQNQKENLVYQSVLHPDADNMILCLEKYKSVPWTKDWKTLLPLYIKASAAEELLKKKPI